MRQNATRTPTGPDRQPHAVVTARVSPDGRTAELTLPDGRRQTIGDGGLDVRPRVLQAVADLAAADGAVPVLLHGFDSEASGPLWVGADGLARPVRPETPTRQAPTPARSAAPVGEAEESVGRLLRRAHTPPSPEQASWPIAWAVRANLLDAPATDVSAIRPPNGSTSDVRPPSVPTSDVRPEGEAAPVPCPSGEAASVPHPSGEAASVPLPIGGEPTPPAVPEAARQAPPEPAPRPASSAMPPVPPPPLPSASGPGPRLRPEWAPLTTPKSRATQEAAPSGLPMAEAATPGAPASEIAPSGAPTSDAALSGPDPGPTTSGVPVPEVESPGARIPREAPSGAPAPEAAPSGTSAPSRTFLRARVREDPARRGLRGALNRLGLSIPADPVETARRIDVRKVSRHWAGPRRIAVVNGKGGVGKTPTVACLSAVFAVHGGSGVLAWDNNETRGTLGWRTERTGHHATVVDLLPHTGELLEPSARAADLAAYVHHQTEDRYDVLRSNPSLLGANLTAEEFDRVMAVTAKYYRLIVLDSGNNESAPNWLRMIDHADAIVVATTAMREAAEAGLLLLDALARRDEHSARLAREAVVVVSRSERATTPLEARRIAQGFGGIARRAVTVPWDPGMVEGHLRWHSLRPATRWAWTAAAAAISDGL